MKKIILILTLFFFSCQSVEKNKLIVFDNDKLNKISISAAKIELNKIYESKFEDPFIDHSLKNPPITRVVSWIESNFNNFGNENILSINILDSSIKRTSKENLDSKKFEKKDIFFYEIFLLLEIRLYSDTNDLISAVTAEVYRSTTSGKFISIIEKEVIIDNLILEALTDLSNEVENLLKIYMNDYLI